MSQPVTTAPLAPGRPGNGVTVRSTSLTSVPKDVSIVCGGRACMCVSGVCTEGGSAVCVLRGWSKEETELGIGRKARAA
eukprot:364905-Chlamydomonas_euryale.AAC.23